MADRDGKADKQGEKKGKGKKAERAAAPAAGDGPSIAAHPRAVRAIGRAKGWAALVGFFLGGYLSLPTNTVAGAGLRALIAGAACYVAVWAGAVFVWRRLVMLELKGREQQLQNALVEAARAKGLLRETPAGGERARAASR